MSHNSTAYLAPTDQAIRQAVRPDSAAPQVPAALTPAVPAAGKPVSGWREGSDGR